MSDKCWWNVERDGLEKVLKKMKNWERTELRPALDRAETVQKDRRKLKMLAANRRRYNDAKYE